MKTPRKLGDKAVKLYPGTDWAIPKVGDFVEISWFCSGTSLVMRDRCRVVRVHRPLKRMELSIERGGMIGVARVEPLRMFSGGHGWVPARPWKEWLAFKKKQTANYKRESRVASRQFKKDYPELFKHADAGMRKRRSA